MKGKEAKLVSLVLPRVEAKRQINERIKKLKSIDMSGGVEQARDQFDQWAKYNEELLKRLFDSDAIASEYNGAIYKAYAIRFAVYSLTPEQEKFAREVEIHVTELKGILDRLELFPEQAELPAVRKDAGTKTELGSDVFVVHGHDEAARETAARFIEKLNLKAIILHEQPDLGRTIIEKFEDHSNVGFAVVLMTPDDVGATKGQENNLKPRARQNVVFELGFFLGKLGRKRVCALYKEGVEIPSDYSGVIYILMDKEGGWQMKLARNIRAAGIPIDLNKAM